MPLLFSRGVEGRGSRSGGRMRYDGPRGGLLRYEDVYAQPPRDAHYAAAYRRPYGYDARSNYQRAPSLAMPPPVPAQPVYGDGSEGEIQRLRAQLAAAERAYGEEKSLGETYPETHGTVAPIRMERLRGQWWL